MPILRRVNDGEGSSGSLVEAFEMDSEGKTTIVGDTPMIGYYLIVGTITASTYSTRDWWMTTPITEFIEEKEENKEYYLKFKTINSEYEFWGTKK